MKEQFNIFIETYPIALTVIKIVITILLASLTIKLLRKSARKYAAKHGPAIHVRFLYNLSKAVVFMTAILVIGSQFDGFHQAVTTLLASSGILALGASLAAQESMANIINGIFISIFKPYNLGDRVSLPEKNNLTGIVTEMNLRHTIITTFANTSYIIPNTQMSTAIIENSNFKNQTYTYPVDALISYASDVKKAMDILAKVISEHPDFVDTRTEEAKAEGIPAVNPSLREFTLNGVNIRASVTVSDVSKSFKACSDIRVRLKEEYDANGIQLSYNTVSVVYKDAPVSEWSDDEWDGK